MKAHLGPNNVVLAIVHANLSNGLVCGIMDEKG
jgi:hypothetical protein